MRFYPAYEQKDLGKVKGLVNSQLSCRLITMTMSGGIHYGIFNHVFDGESIFLHLNRDDEQVADLTVNPQALLVFEDLLCLIPSYWVDESYGGAATAYYRYAEFECRAELLTSPEEIRCTLEKMMDRYQPEGRYAPLDPGAPLYKKSFDSLVIVRLVLGSPRTKWKLGQNRSVEMRRGVAQRLREKGNLHDLRAAEEVEQTIGVAQE